MIFAFDPGTTVVPATGLHLQASVEVSWNVVRTTPIMNGATPPVQIGTQTVEWSGSAGDTIDVTFNRGAIPWADLSGTDVLAAKEFIVFRREPPRPSGTDSGTFPDGIGTTTSWGGTHGTKAGHAYPRVVNCLTWIGNTNGVEIGDFGGNVGNAVFLPAMFPWDAVYETPEMTPFDHAPDLLIEDTGTMTGSWQVVTSRSYTDDTPPTTSTDGPHDVTDTWRARALLARVRMKDEDGLSVPEVPWDYSDARFKVVLQLGAEDDDGGFIPSGLQLLSEETESKTIDVATLKAGGSVDFGGTVSYDAPEPTGGSVGFPVGWPSGYTMPLDSHTSVNDFTYKLRGHVSLS